MSRGELRNVTLSWLVRIYTATVLLLWNVVGAVCLYLAVALGKDRAILVMPAMAPFLLPALLAVFNWAAFPFEYSVFGQYKRTEFPEEEVLCRIEWSRIVISWCLRNDLGVTWYVFPSGVGISMSGIGRVFLPFMEIEEITKVGSSRYRVSHTCPEVRSPIIMPSRVVDAILWANKVPAVTAG